MKIKLHQSVDTFSLNLHVFKFPVCKTGLMTSSLSPRGGVKIDPRGRVKYSKATVENATERSMGR